MAPAAPLPFPALALSRDGRQFAVLQGEKVLRYALPSLQALPTLTRLPGEDTTFMEEPLTPAAASTLAFDPAGKRLVVGWGMSFPKAYSPSRCMTSLHFRSSGGLKVRGPVEIRGEFQAFGSDTRERDAR